MRQIVLPDPGGPPTTVNDLSGRPPTENLVQVPNAGFYPTDLSFLHIFFSPVCLLRESLRLTLDSSECNAGVRVSAVKLPMTVRSSTSMNWIASLNSPSWNDPACSRNSAKLTPSAPNLREPRMEFLPWRYRARDPQSPRPLYPLKRNKYDSKARTSPFRKVPPTGPAKPATYASSTL